MSEATPGGPRPATVAPTTPVPPARVPAAPARGHAVIADTIDGTQLRTLLATLMRVRTRTRPRFGRSSRPRGLIFQIVLYGLMGGFTGMIALAGTDVFTFALVLGGVTLFVAGMGMVAESGDLLFNASEHDILGHRPVGARTLLLARSLSLFALTMVLTLSLNLAPLFLGLAAHGARPWFPLAHFVAMTLLALFCAGAVVFVYVLLTRLVGRKRFDAFASWLQMGVSVTFILGYQIIPRMLDRTHGLHVSPEKPWVSALPPAWFAALEVLMNGGVPQAELRHLLPMAAAGLAATATLAGAAVFWLSGDYARRVASLSESSGPSPRDAAARVAAVTGSTAAIVPSLPARVRDAKGPGRFEWLLHAWMPDPVERAAFRLASTYMRHDRDVRMRLYPGLATYLVFPIIAFINPAKSSYIPALAMVMASMLTGNVMYTLKVSPQYLAADVFHYAPLEGTAALFHGVRKAAVLFVTLPVTVASALLLLLAVPDREQLVAVVPALVLMPTLSLLVGLGGDYLPLALPPTTGRQSAIISGLYLLSAVVVGGLSVGGWFARQQGWFWPLVAGEVVLVAFLHALLLRGIRARPLTRLA